MSMYRKISEIIKAKQITTADIHKTITVGELAFYVTNVTVGQVGLIRWDEDQQIYLRSAVPLGWWLVVCFKDGAYNAWNVMGDKAFRLQYERMEEMEEVEEVGGESPVLFAAFDAIISEVHCPRKHTLANSPPHPKEMRIGLEVMGNTSSPDLVEVIDLQGEERVRVTITEIIDVKR